MRVLSRKNVRIEKRERERERERGGGEARLLKETQIGEGRVRIKEEGGDKK